MTQYQISRYLTLVARRLFIIRNSGISSKSDYFRELELINEELSSLRLLVDLELSERSSS